MDGEDMTVKARMLKLLEQHENELISGEAAAAELNCTRAAIWKAVKSSGRGIHHRSRTKQRLCASRRQPVI